MIKVGERAALPYRGDCTPVDIDAGGSKIAGWHWAELSGPGNAALDGTYNDTAAVTIYGFSAQAGIPSPSNPVEITSVENPVVTVTGNNGQNQSVTLPHTLYGIKDNTGVWRCRDTIDFARKILVRQCADVTLSRSNNYGATVYRDLDAKSLWCLIGWFDNPKYAAKYGSAMYMTHLPWLPFGQTSPDGNWLRITSGANGRGQMLLSKALLGVTDEMTGAQKNERLLNWLDVNRPRMVYQLATPTETPLPELEELKSFYPYTSVSCTDGAGEAVDVTLRAKVTDTI